MKFSAEELVISLERMVEGILHLYLYLHLNMLCICISNLYCNVSHKFGKNGGRYFVFLT